MTMITPSLHACRSTLDSAELRNVPPKLAGDLDVTVKRGRSVVITTEDLTAIDPDDSADELSYAVSNASNGIVALAANAGVSVDRFTQADIEAGRVLFVHDGGDSNTASFDVLVSDESGGVPSSNSAASEATGGLDRERIDLLWKIARAGARSAVGTEARRQFRYDGDMNIGVITDFELEVRNALNRRAHAVGAQDVVQHGTEQNNPFPEADEKIFVVSATGESQMLTRGQLKEYIGQQRGEGYVFYENRAYGVAGKSLFDDGLGAAPGVPSGRSKFSPDVLETVPASPGLRRPSLGAVERQSI